jgi:hypothetical protein
MHSFFLFSRKIPVQSDIRYKFIIIINKFLKTNKHHLVHNKTSQSAQRSVSVIGIGAGPSSLAAGPTSYAAPTWERSPTPSTTRGGRAASGRRCIQRSPWRGGGTAPPRPITPLHTSAPQRCSHRAVAVIATAAATLMIRRWKAAAAGPLLMINGGWRRWGRVGVRRRGVSPMKALERRRAPIGDRRGAGGAGPGQSVIGDSSGIAYHVGVR